MNTIQEIREHFAASTKPLTAEMHSASPRRPERVEAHRVMVLGIHDDEITIAMRTALNWEDLIKAPLDPESGKFIAPTGYVTLESFQDDATAQEIWSCGRIKAPRSEKSVAQLSYERERDARTIVSLVNTISVSGDIDNVIVALEDFRIKHFGAGSESEVAAKEDMPDYLKLSYIPTPPIVESAPEPEVEVATEAEPEPEPVIEAQESAPEPEPQPVEATEQAPEPVVADQQDEQPFEAQEGAPESVRVEETRSTVPAPEPEPVRSEEVPEPEPEVATETFSEAESFLSAPEPAPTHEEPQEAAQEAQHDEPERVTSEEPEVSTKRQPIFDMSSLANLPVPSSAMSAAPIPEPETEPVEFIMGASSSLGGEAEESITSSPVYSSFLDGFSQQDTAPAAETRGGFGLDLDLDVDILSLLNDDDTSTGSPQLN